MKRPLTDLETLRAQELLVQRATEGLDDAAAAELDRLGAADLDTFDLAAAEIALAAVPMERMPPALAEQVLAAALRAAGPAPAETATAPASSPSPMTAPAVPAVAAVIPGMTESSLPRVTRSSRATAPAASRDRVEPRGWGRWAVAVGGWAAAAALAVVVWSQRPGATARRDEPRPVAPLPAGGVAATLEPGAGAGDRAVSGDVVWHAAAQRGELHVRGLAPNDPRVERYQLWIVDGAREAGQAVDGGLFDVTAAGPLVVPIAPRLPVVQPIEVLITVEAPIGAVVSSRRRVAARAALPRR